MNDDLCEMIDALDALSLADGVIGAYWCTASKCWRIQLDNEDFLREIEIWDENKAPGSKYPYELVANRGTVEVFCLVKELPK